MIDRLPRETSVLPTENHVYIRFVLGGREYWGNIFLPPDKRDAGVLHLTYYEFKDNMRGIEDTVLFAKDFGPESGLRLTRKDSLHYVAEYRDRVVAFTLNQVDQGPPRGFELVPDEEMVFRMHDESNFRFVLLFNRVSEDFLYVLDEDGKRYDGFEEIVKGVVMDPISRFVFFVDTAHESRKILIGVHRQSVMRNDYFDGPADQAADNFLDERYSRFMQQIYPETRGFIDKYGRYPGGRTRVAVSPYYAYSSVDEFAQILDACRRNDQGSAFYACIAPDFQKMLGRNPARTAEFPTLEIEKPAAKPGRSPAMASPVSQAYAQSGETGHMSTVTWHLTGATFLPAGGTHMSNATWHITGATFLQPGGIHMDTVTWHVSNETFLPVAGIHMLNVTWHMNNTSFLPVGGAHMPPTTWHINGATFLPAHGGHMDPTTWHITDATFLTPGGGHMENATWHITGPTFMPAGGAHMENVTWHFTNGTFLPARGGHMLNATWHIAGATFMPAGGAHMDPTTWHITNGTFLPARGSHMLNATWHITGPTFLPAGGAHMQNATWHIADGTFLPVGGSHMNNATWHITGATFLPAGGAHMGPTTWHIANGTFLPVGGSHMLNATWHITNGTFLPAGGKHMTAVSWHVGGASFLPAQFAQQIIRGVPALADWALVVLAVLMMLSGFWCLRRT